MPSVTWSKIQEVETVIWRSNWCKVMPPDDDDFTIDELDYQRIAEANLASAQPDWLMDIDEQSQPDTMQMEEVGLALDGVPTDETHREKPDCSPRSAAPTMKMKSDITGELPDWLDEEMPVEALPPALAAEIDSGDLGDALDWLQDDNLDTEATTEGVPDFFDTGELSAQMNEDDPLAWLGRWWYGQPG